MIVAIRAPSLSLCVCIGHAPHSRRPPTEIQQWWKDLADFCREQKRGAERLITLVGANAALGSVTDHTTGGAHPEEQNLPGECLKRFLHSTVGTIYLL
eukprot:5001590-Pyramimonas_sp.AAC.1